MYNILRAMFKNVIIGGVLILLNSCTAQKNQKFDYIQDFKPEISDIKSQKDRLVFEDVREELKLHYPSANWILTDNGVSLVGSRRAQILKRRATIAETYQGGKDYATIRDYRVPWFTLSMGDLNWCDYTTSTTVKLTGKSIAGIAFRYLNSREYYAFLLDAEKARRNLFYAKSTRSLLRKS